MIDLLLINSVYFVWLLVPLVPAVVLYLIFPTALVETQWNVSGVAVKASGATGLYLAIIGLSYVKFLSPSLEYVKTLRPPYWTVDAPITFLDAENHGIVPTTNSAEQIRVQPYAYEFRQTDAKSYLVTLRFSELNGDTESIRLIFPEGEGYIHLKDLMTASNTYPLLKRINLTKEPPIKIQPPLKGGQNQPLIAAPSRKLERSLETNDLQAAAK
jgi:hypothetical protein